MNTKKVDIINVFLIIISLIIAIRLPFKLFLLSYAILGPLHYLTEIVWLREKNYFVKNTKNWVYLFLLFAIVMSIPAIIKFVDTGMEASLKEALKSITSKTRLLPLIGFLFSISLIFFTKVKHLVMALISAVAISFLSNSYFPEPLLFVGVFLPTLVHVYVFTLLFIFYGAIKSKSRYGIYLGVLLILVPFIISYIPLNQESYKPSSETLDTFVSSNMIYINAMLVSLLKTSGTEKFHILSEIAVRVQIFIAFAYTYHYLNWFSKTSIIGWKKAITKKNAYLIVFIWLLSIGVYIYDFKTGFIALLFLSLLHVFLEFPLNVVTIKEIILKITNKKK